LTQLGYGLSGADVSVDVTLLDGGQAVNDATANIADRSAPSGTVWVSRVAFSARYCGPPRRPLPFPLEQLALLSPPERDPQRTR